MSNLKRLSLLTAVALAVVGYAAVPASADILSPGSGGSVYSGAMKGVRSGAAPTLVSGPITITCQQVTIDGTMNGDASGGSATAVLDISFANCMTNGGVPCTISSVTGVSFNVTEANNPSFTFVNTETFGMTITCGPFYSCNWSSNPSTTPVTIEVNQASQVATISDTMNVSGPVGCPASGTGTLNLQIGITDDQDQDLDLWATGTL